MSFGTVAGKNIYLIIMLTFLFINVTILSHLCTLNNRHNCLPYQFLHKGQHQTTLTRLLTCGCSPVCLSQTVLSSSVFFKPASHSYLCLHTYKNSHDLASIISMIYLPFTPLFTSCVCVSQSLFGFYFCLHSSVTRRILKMYHGFSSKTILVTLYLKGCA